MSVITTVPFPYRICDCLVAYFDSSSPDSRNVSLVADCAFYLLFSSDPLGVFQYFQLLPESQKCKYHAAGTNVFLLNDARQLTCPN